MEKLKVKHLVLRKALTQSYIKKKYKITKYISTDSKYLKKCKRFHII